MTVGVLCLDGLDWTLSERTRALSTLPGDPWTAELTNDLPGHPDHGEYSLFTPHVWTSIFAGELQDAVWGWNPPEIWRAKTDDMALLWDKIPGTSVNNLKVHGGYLNKYPVVPDGFTPVHGEPDEIRTTANMLGSHWNRGVMDAQPPVLVCWWRLADGWGHWAVRNEERLEPCYEWIRDEFIPALNFPDNWILVSDHGFKTETRNGPEGKGASGRHQHRPTGVIATNMDGVRYENMTDFVTGWHDDVTDTIERDNLRALGYLD